MRKEEDPDAGGSRTCDDRTEMFEKTDLVRNLLHHRPDLSAVREEIIVGIYQTPRIEILTFGSSWV